MAGNEDFATTALNTIIGALTPLNSDERHRIVGAAMMFLGEKPVQLKGGKADQDGDDEQVHSAAIQKWMKQNGVSSAQVEQVFHFGEDGAFDIFDTSGTTKKERMLNTYVLTGLAKYLATGDRSFDDATARKYCEQFGCYDQGNFAMYMRRDRGADFTGEKARGYMLTNVGIKRGADLVKQMAGGAK
jgi:hypothetical protein